MNSKKKKTIDSFEEYKKKFFPNEKHSQIYIDDKPTVIGAQLSHNSLNKLKHILQRGLSNPLLSLTRELRSTQNSESGGSKTS